MNHLGVEVMEPGEVASAESRLGESGLATTGLDDTACCYATKTETWVTDPDGAPWEWYVRTGDSEQMSNQVLDGGDGAGCCAPAVSGGADPEPNSDEAVGCC